MTPSELASGVERRGRHQVTASRRVASLPPYAFAEIDKEIEALREQGIEPIDFGVGDPVEPTPDVVRQATQRAVDEHARSGYPSYIGALSFRTAAAEWMKRRFGVDVDPRTEVTSSIGSKELVFNLHEGFVDPGDVVIVPSPGYPPYVRGTLFAEGTPYFYPVDRRNGFVPDLDAIPADVRRRAKMMWICQPHSPSGRVLPKAFLEEAVAFAAEHRILLFSDEAYSEIYFTETPPHSILECSRDGVAAVFSMSKRSAMTGYRIGWLAGDRRINEIVRKVKTNIDSGTPLFVQDGARAALADEEHVKRFREEYRARRDLMVDALTSLGLPECRPEATLYIWQEVPKGWNGLQFAKRLLQEDVAIAAIPGAWLSEPVDGGENPGTRFVRFALVPSREDTLEAARRIRTMSLGAP